MASISSVAGSRWRVDALLLAIMLAWGLNISVVKALSGVLDEIWVGLLRMAVASLTLTVCLLARDRRLPRLDLGQAAALGAAGFLMVYANQMLFTHGMHLAAATGASLVMALSPTLTVVAAALIFRERVSVRRIVGLAVGFGGVTLVIFHREGASVIVAGLGEWMVLCALLTFVLGGALVQRLSRRLDALVIGWAIYAGGTLMLAAHAVATQGSILPSEGLDGQTWLLVLYSGVLGTAISNVGWYHAIASVGMARASLFFYWLPIFGIGFAVVFLAEAFTGWHVAGLILVLAGTRLGTARA